MRYSGVVCVMLLAAASVLASLPCAADEAAVAGRTILENNKKAVITVQLVIKQKLSMAGMGSREQETKTEITGTVLDETGLTVMSLTATDPSHIQRQMMGDEINFSSELTDVKILRDDGREIPAQVVLRDGDLDLAFLRPTEAVAEPFSPVKTDVLGTPEILDELIALNRLGKVATRSYAASVERIESIVTKPRTLYVPGQGDTSAGLGSPCFTMDGAFVGIGVVRVAPSSGGGMMSMLSGSDRPIAVIIPAEKILETAKQAPQVDASKGADAQPSEEAVEEAPAEEGQPAAPEEEPTRSEDRAGTGEEA